MIRRVSRARKRRDKLTNEPYKQLDNGRVRTRENAQGKAEYKRLTLDMAHRQNDCCAICGIYFGPDWTPTFDHAKVRNAANIDERIEVDGHWQNAALCVLCQGSKGSQHYEWRENKYQPVIRGE